MLIHNSRRDPISALSRELIASVARAALQEDRAHRDVTSLGLFSAHERIQAKIIFKGNWAVVCGSRLTMSCFRLMDPHVKISIRRDGSKIRKGETVATLDGRARAVLAAERTALNFLGHLSGIATLAQKFVQAAKKLSTSAMISDTRKTLPLLRDLEKYAVSVGGAAPHRRDLSRMALIKDNHLAILKRKHGATAYEVLAAKIENFKKRGIVVEVEAQDDQELEGVLRARPDWIMLDNWNPAALKAAIAKIGQASAGAVPKIEISGGITLENIAVLARRPAARLSVGALTHSAPFANFSLEIV